ncbi:hypothetical protein OB919_06880 [Halobacteria archaeon AArc-curdl1]|uniref:Uncharacterized protein n=1 Tax=Natronosalvus hydrolyticus TaxID=2979988 RepID=A0AAP3E682_9EURY|nr:hypothetical protein [Halobacteria archaeon AArc-curdl1]
MDAADLDGVETSLEGVMAVADGSATADVSTTTAFNALDTYTSV